MRLFEIIVILVNLAALVLSIRKVPKKVWLSVVAANGLVLLLHSIVEGMRWQMTFSYAFVGLLVICTIARQHRLLAKINISKLLKAAIITFGVLGLIITSFLAHTLPVFNLPKPTGTYAVGFKYLALTDDDRTDPFLSGSNQKRQIMAKVYYPAQSDDSKPYAPYFNGSKELMEAYAGFYHLPKFAFSHFGLVSTHSKADLVLSNKEPKYPVVLFSNGAGATPEVETAQSEELASHGYVVIDIDHTYVSAATVFPDRIVTANQATTDFKVPEPAEPITQIMADDDEFVIGELTELNNGGIDPSFKGKLDMDKIGVMGHSVGGAVAYNMALNNPSIKAAINLDGAVYVAPKEGQTIAPFLMLANDKYHVQAVKNRESLMMKFDNSPEGQQIMKDIYGSKEAYDKELQKSQKNVSLLTDTLKSSNTLYTITGSDHMKFTDIGLYIGNKKLREFVQIGGDTDPARALEVTNAVTLTFMDRYLKGKSTSSVDSLLPQYPELKKAAIN